MAVSFDRRSRMFVVPLPPDGFDQKKQAVSRVQQLSGRGNHTAAPLSSSLGDCCRRVRWNKSGMPTRHEYLKHGKMSQ